jgi:hypothetical protein
MLRWCGKIEKLQFRIKRNFFGGVLQKIIKKWAKKWPEKMLRGFDVAS